MDDEPYKEPRETTIIQYETTSTTGLLRIYGQSHPEWGSWVRYMGVENYTLVVIRLYSPNTNEVIINSATFPPGPKNQRHSNYKSVKGTNWRN